MWIKRSNELLSRLHGFMVDRWFVNDKPIHLRIAIIVLRAIKDKMTLIEIKMLEIKKQARNFNL